jgi:hypothetical protein
MVNAARFVHSDLKGVIERANEILEGLDLLTNDVGQKRYVLGLMTDKVGARDIDIWEQTSWALARLELKECSLRLEDPNIPASKGNGNLPGPL